MDEARPLISICIPAYNRSALLEPLLESILSQRFASCEIVVCEDRSPERALIARVVERARSGATIPIHYWENERTLGYDGNLRNLVARANGRYCLFMGNDDLLAQGALDAVGRIVRGHPDVGVVLRSYASFREDPREPEQHYRYFADEKYFNAGAAAVSVFYRRSVVISGLVVRRDDAHAVATERYDGTLLYQLYLVGRILMKANGVSTPEIIAYYRLGGTPDFGHSDSEAGRFTPGAQTPESSLSFMRGMLDIAKGLDCDVGSPVSEWIVRDIAVYSLPVLSVQAGLPLRRFIAYAAELRRMGLAASPLFYVYFVALAVFGRSGTDKIVAAMKRLLGGTPAMGAVARTA